MDDTTETPSAGAGSEMPPPEARPVTPGLGAFPAALAGLHAGILGALWMLAWLGIDSVLDRRGFWAPENLFATAFYGNDALSNRFGWKTFSGIALWVMMYGLLGCVFASVVRGRLRPRRRTLAAMVFALVWFYAAFHGLWKTAMPLVYLLYPERPTIIGHLIYGLVLAGFPTYFHRPRRAPTPPPAPPEELPPAGQREAL